MSRKTRSSSKDIVELAREYESATAALAAAQARVAQLQRRLVTAVDSAAPASTARAAATRNGATTGSRRRKATDWGKVRADVLAAMQKGRLYTGNELQEMARVRASTGTFIANVRDELLASSAIKKVTADKKPWKKGMSPRSVRWLRA